MAEAVGKCRHHGRRIVASILVSLSWPAASCASSSSHINAAACAQPASRPVAIIELPGNPFQAVPTSDGCHVFVSLAGPTEPSDPRRPPRPGAPVGGVAVVSRVGGEPLLTRMLQLEGSPWGMALTRDDGLLIVASDDRVAFIDSARLIAGSADAILGYLHDAPTAGRFYANVTPDDRWLFLSDESAQAISVVDLAKARASGFDNSAVIGQIPTGRAPIALTFSMDHRHMYTTSQVAPAVYGWPAVCSAPGSEAARQTAKYAEGAILVVDVSRATHDPANAVVSAAPAGCNPVRLATSASGDVAYVSARTDNALLAFDTRRLLIDPSHALIGRVPVGDAPVGVAVLDGGARIAVTNSNRFGGSSATQNLTIIDARKITSGAAAVLGTVPAGVFPRELRLTNDGKTLLLTNFGSKNLAMIDMARLPLARREE
ncbi:PQQ-dependent catabolism-associated beta-propeller protein [Luteitalea pratensis]|uniref:PQQ-dependent catabolism-associated beta-propeller protein n=2 Tax=Luteitalea pratensis TaxID=1855912 RepID=A0A143PL54_LUTPR|nr:PQQ-dependent catabolism-associated beta-propeller protein [Luteitalea pratensis]